ncbi:tetratricopeptide repeat protein [Alkalibacillus almallahensis]|uniref:tetratricopeptide repeat protein n=1 Tax=Alkalibacillus almallahensis TaxID=1379154 RepID=UPI00141EC9CE|nr:tetratricopeptide repeat protein [Alkalibacillus almallahensis]NIK11217.1 tetratricopeptide (TPR) repeat protein [Alkalibacillus almallahensis]
MSDDKQDVVMFPRWRKELENKTYEAIQKKYYEEALLHIKKLEDFNEASHDIITAKVIAYVELARYDEAISLCRRLMREDQDHYYKYLHIYLTILFQTSQYQDLIELLDEIFETETVPFEYQDAFQQLYDVSADMRASASETESVEHINHFIEALENGNFQEQWKLLSYHRKHEVDPYLEMVKPYLSDTRLNPVIKTGILQWFMEEKVEEAVEVEKFGESDHVRPVELSDVLDTSFAKSVIHYLEDVEQNDPTLFEFLKQILYRYLYIKFPFVPQPTQNNVTDLGEAVLLLAQQYLQLNEGVDKHQEATPEQQEWMKDIERLEKIYFSQIGE